MVYLDWAATALPDTAILNQVKEKEARFFGNPSSIHTAGKESRAFLEDSRSVIARSIHAKPVEIIFTSGGTESNNTILFSLLTRIQKTGISPKITLITTGIEHPSVFEPASSLGRFGIQPVFVQPDGRGIVDPEKIRNKLDEHTVLVSVMMVNNETGSVQRVRAISEVICDFASRHGRKIIFHVDAVQGLGKIELHPHELGIDAASLSCHKLGGPKGAGALFLSEDVHPEILYKGGDQEFSKRPGTENPGGCFGFALACEARIARLDKNHTNATKLAERLVSGIRKIENAVIIPEIRKSDVQHEHFSPYILKVAFPYVPGEVLVRVLDEKGIAVSTGAACSSRKQNEKHRVLLNMGIPIEIASSSIRISTGFSTEERDIDALLEVLGNELPALRRVSGYGTHAKDV